MKFATLSHLLNQDNLKFIPKSWIKDNMIVSPEIEVMGTKGHITGLLLTSHQMMELPKEVVRQRILDAALFIQNELEVDVIQLGALTTSVTDGGVWMTKQNEYKCFVNHGDSYTAAVTCQAVSKALHLFKKESSDQILAIVGAYGVIGEAVSKIIVPQFKHSILIGRKKEKFKELEEKLQGNFETTVDFKTKEADVIITATSHPEALLKPEHLKNHAIIVDVSQPPNLSL